MVSPGCTLDTPLAKAPGIGPKAAKLLADAFAMSTVRDLIYHFPRRYAERGELTRIADLVVGEEVTILARVERTGMRRMTTRPGSIFEAVVGDGSGGTLTLTYFLAKENRGQWLVRDLRPGVHALFAGTVSKYKRNKQLAHPEHHVLADASTALASVDEFANAIIPIYPATQKLRSWKIAQCVRTVLDVLSPPPDPVPASLRVARKLIDLPAALREMHLPRSHERLGAARKRLIWDEAFAVQVALVQRKLRAAATPAAPRTRAAVGLLADFDATLRFELTDGQVEVGRQIATDLERDSPMHRLLQGEVGSGKTVCALRAMLQVIDAGGQAVLLSPTEVLAAQHHRSIRELLGPLGRAGELDSADRATAVELITGSQGATARRRAVQAVASGQAGIVVGTHALLYDEVSFADLALVVIDEQHRFGVEQRDTLRAKAEQPPHVLVMTATPIPRTVAMTVFGDLEVSTLAELPKGRSPIATHVVPVAEKPSYFDRAWRRLREEVELGRQGYVVCPRIGGEAAADDASVRFEAGERDVAAGDGVAGDSDQSAVASSPRRAPIAVVEVAPQLVAGPLAGLRVGVLHGRLPSDEKDSVMRDFAGGRLDVLIATTVVEVGVDVPNATVMIVLDADRFGVSQLHQLRGRVGRGEAPGLCLLVTDADADSPARQRLDAVAATRDGFRLAELDLELRREGDVLGEAQSGRAKHLRLLSLLRDADVIADARQEAIELLDRDPQLSAHPVLAEALASWVDEERAQFLEKG